MKVLVPIEDPFFAACIVDFIQHHEWPAKTEFLVMHVIEPYFLDKVPAVSFAPFLDVPTKTIIEEASRLVSTVSQSINNAHPSATVAQEVVEAHVVDQIKRVAEKWPADLVVAGSHGRSGFSKFFLGSVSLELANELQTPLLLVKPDKQTLKTWDDLDYPSLTHASFAQTLAKLGSTQQFRKILVALDDTKLSRQLIEFCLHHKWSTDAEFKLFSSIDERPFFFLPADLKDKLAEKLVEDQQVMLSEFVALIKARLPMQQVETEIERGSAKANIISACHNWNANLLIVGNHGGTGKCALGSIALSSLCAAPCSVLLVKEDSWVTTAASAVVSDSETKAVVSAT
jgi:nucleotide-binding universal stress UspA family protein